MFRQLNNVSFRRSIGNFTFWVNNFLSDLSYSCSSRLQSCLLIFNLVFLRERSAKIDIEIYLAYEIFNKSVTGTQECWKIQVVTGSWPIEGECIMSIFAKIQGWGDFPPHHTGSDGTSIVDVYKFHHCYNKKFGQIQDPPTLSSSIFHNVVKKLSCFQKFSDATCHGAHPKES